MRYTGLEAIAIDICSAANIQFSRQKKYTDQKWILCNDKTTLTFIDLVDIPVSFTAFSLKNHVAYISRTFAILLNKP